MTVSAKTIPSVTCNQFRGATADARCVQIVMEYLRTRDCSINDRDEHGDTWVHIAALANKDKPLSSILTHDRKAVDILSAPTRGNGLTALQALAERRSKKNAPPDWRDAKTLGILIQHGADVNCQFNKGLTALHVLAKSSKTSSCIRTLAESGADLLAKDCDGKLPIDHCTDKLGRKTLRALMDKSTADDGKALTEESRSEADSSAEEKMSEDGDASVAETTSKQTATSVSVKPPWLCGMRVADLARVNVEIKDDLAKYCGAHQRVGRKHLCTQDPCPFLVDHCGAPLCKDDEATSSDAAPSLLVPNMHLVVTRHVKPKTKESGSCYALTVHPEGLAITTFVTHTWGGIFSELVDVLSKAFSPQEAVWICSFALYQHGDIGAMLSDDLLQSPFAQALQRADKHIVVIDSSFEVLTRAWCVYEVFASTEYGKQMFFWMHAGVACRAGLKEREQLRARAEELDLSSAEASEKNDLDRIKADVQRRPGGFDELNAVVRDCITDRIRFFNAAVEAAAQHTSYLEDQLATLKRSAGQDAKKIEDLEARLRRNMALASDLADCKSKGSQLQKRLATAVHELDSLRRKLAKAEDAAKWHLEEQLQWMQERVFLHRQLQASHERLEQALTDSFRQQQTIDRLELQHSLDGPKEPAAESAMEPSPGESALVRFKVRLVRAASVDDLGEHGPCKIPHGDSVERAAVAAIRSATLGMGLPAEGMQTLFSINGKSTSARAELASEPGLEDCGGAPRVLCTLLDTSEASSRSRPEAAALAPPNPLGRTPASSRPSSRAPSPAPSSTSHECASSKLRCPSLPAIHGATPQGSPGSSRRPSLAP